jgi:hypothetical protein
MSPNTTGLLQEEDSILQTLVTDELKQIYSNFMKKWYYMYIYNEIPISINKIYTIQKRLRVVYPLKCIQIHCNK